MATVLLLVACGGDDNPTPKTPEQAERPPRRRGGGVENRQRARRRMLARSGRGRPASTGGALSAYTAGWNAYLSGDLNTAKKKFQDAQSQDSKSPAPSHALGIVLERLGDIAGAQAAYRAAPHVESGS